MKPRVLDAPAGAEIIEFGDLERTERLAIKGRDYDACKHWRTVIDEHLRVVTCRDCSERLDAVEVLIDIAKHWRSESYHAKRIAEFEAKERDRTAEKEKRFVRQHIVCNGCGLQTRLTIGQLSDADRRAWDEHWGTEPEHPASWDVARTLPERHHRRRTEADIDASRRAIEPVHLYGGATYVERVPRPQENAPRIGEPE